MRLIRTTSTDLELAYVANENKIPKYAILSHVWGDEEVTFQDMQDPLKRKGMKGWPKVVGACELARREDWEYIWIDTCCIDKTSSTELAEAINSMYSYYSKAEVCYAHLSDMQSGHLSRSFNLSFRMCKWFTRGWTLQELIAPVTVFFFTDDWEKIGTKASLHGIITEITGIPSRVLLSEDDLSESSIAARMSWAAGRETTRVEDRAYSLMGIFGVYMPPIYGEGEHAFIRLQEEILKVSNDHSIFAWNLKKSFSMFHSGVLATSPDVFKGSGEYTPLHTNNEQPFSMTNLGLLVHLPLLRILPAINGKQFTVKPLPEDEPVTDDELAVTDEPVIDDKPEFLALLNCRSKTSSRLAIHVKRSTIDEKQYERVQSNMLEDDAILAKCGEFEENPQELLFKPWNLSRFRRNHFSSDRIAVFVSGGQGIKPIRVNSSNADLSSLAAKIKADPGDHSMGVFTLDRFRLPRTFLFIHDPTRRPFVVVAGDGWLDIVLDFKVDDKRNLDQIQRSYKHDMSRKNLDRMSKFLTENVAILVETRRQYQSGLEACYVLNIRIVNKIYLHVAPAVLPVQYAFSISFSSVIDAGFSLLETYPDNAWEKWNNDTINLFLDNASTTGTLCFQHKQNQKIFAVTIGFRNKTLWSDVYFLMSTKCRESAKDICDSYCNNQKRRTRIGDKSSNKFILPQDPSSGGNWVLTVSVRVLRNSDKQHKSEIKVTREWEKYSRSK